jgi:hypothetical protein
LLWIFLAGQVERRGTKSELRAFSAFRFSTLRSGATAEDGENGPLPVFFEFGVILIELRRVFV